VSLLCQVPLDDAPEEAYGRPDFAPFTCPVLGDAGGSQVLRVARSDSRQTPALQGESNRMNLHHRPAQFLKFAAMSCALLSCLIALPTPALAVAIYDVFVQASVSAPGPIPSGTSFSFVPGFTTIQQASFTGNALATAAASTQIGSATALVTGFASAPGPSNAESVAQAMGQVNLVNLNATTVTFPLTFSHTRFQTASRFPLGNETESIFTSAGIFANLDNENAFGPSLFANFSDACSSFVPGNCNSFDSGSAAFLLGLTPGSHSLRIFVDARGGAAHSAASPSPVPEPTSLLLFGTTAAGLGLARWRKTRSKRPAQERQEKGDRREP
jgi:hypothetical protein